jgi:hypothetical protein
MKNCLFKLNDGSVSGSLWETQRASEGLFELEQPLLKISTYWHWLLDLVSRHKTAMMSALDDKRQFCVTEKLKVDKGEPSVGCSGLKLVVRRLTSTNGTTTWRKPTTHMDCDTMNKLQ